MKKVRQYLELASADFISLEGHDIFYHGTRAEFNEFRPHFKRNMQLGFGIHFTIDRQAALLYTTSDYSKGKVPTLYTARLKANKILDTRQLYNVDKDPEIYKLAVELFKGTRRFGGKPYVSEGLFLVIPDITSGQRAERILRAYGFDAIIYKARHLSTTGYNTFSIGREYPSVVVLDPQQIVVVNKEIVGP